MLSNQGGKPGPCALCSTFFCSTAFVILCACAPAFVIDFFLYPMLFLLQTRSFNRTTNKQVW